MGLTVVKKVAESKVKQDVNGRNYKTCTFEKMGKREVYIPGIGNIVVDDKPIRTSINLWEENYLNNTADYGYHTPVDTQKDSFLFGDIVTRKVAPYEIKSVNKQTGELVERTVDTYTTVVFDSSGNADAFENAVKRTFTSRQHPVMDGTPTSPAETAQFTSDLDMIA
jgi:hypothetical protein